MPEWNRTDAALAAMQLCTHDGVPAQESWLDCAIADGGRLRLVLLVADPRAALPLLDRARQISMVLAVRCDAGLRFLWEAGRQTGDPEDPPAAFLAGFTPSDLVVAADGGYVLHFAPRDAAWFMAGYWPALHYNAEHQATGWTCES